ncbi:MAG TPA: hypothetical protein DCZ10_08600 [Pelotomaculum sp.]|nr:hypothetical protein [Pelotomaculum sp.]
MIGINKRVAAYMGNSLDLDNDNREVIAYSLELLFHTAVTIFLVMFVAWLIGPVKEAIVLLIVMFLFKSFAGGVHCSSAVRCTILSILLIPSFSQLSYVAGQHFSLSGVVVFTSFSILFSYAIVYKLAPVNLPIVSIRHKQNRRNFSFVLLGLITLVQILLIALVPTKTASYIVAIDISIFWQALMLTKQGHAIVNYYDKLLLYLVGKGGDKNETY